MIGGGPLLPVCRQLVRGLNMDGAVAFRGPEGHAQVAAAMRTARAFVQHSVVASNGDCEGTPVAVLEAQAAGLPVVSTRHTGITQVVLEGETGYLVEELDIEAMAGRMLHLAADPSLAAKLGGAGRARIREAFTMERQIGELYEVLQRAASRALHCEA